MFGYVTSNCQEMLGYVSLGRVWLLVQVSLFTSD